MFIILLYSFPHSKGQISINNFYLKYFNILPKVKIHIKSLFIIYFTYKRPYYQKTKENIGWKGQKNLKFFKKKKNLINQTSVGVNIDNNTSIVEKTR